MSRKPETPIQQNIQKMLRNDFGAFCFKVHGGPFQRAGIPDILACVEGLYVAIEAKTPDGELDGLQIHTMKEIRRAGGIAFHATSPEQARRKLRKRLNALTAASKKRG